MGAYKRGSHTIWDCKYHVVWATKYRYAVLGGDVGQRRRRLLREAARALVRVGFFILPNNVSETFRSAETCRSIVVLLRHPRIGVMQNGAAEMGIVAAVDGGGRCGRGTE
jgi:hypothetical protein